MPIISNEEKNENLIFFEYFQITPTMHRVLRVRLRRTKMRKTSTLPVATMATMTMLRRDLPTRPMAGVTAAAPIHRRTHFRAAVRRSTGVIGPPSQRSNYTSWSEHSNVVTIPMCTAAKSWLSRSICPKFEFRLVHFVVFLNLFLYV